MGMGMGGRRHNNAGRRRMRRGPITLVCCLAAIHTHEYCGVKPTCGFPLKSKTTTALRRHNLQPQLSNGRVIRTFSNIYNHQNNGCRRFITGCSSSQLSVVAEVATSAELMDYAPAASALFYNLKLPAAVVTAGMISLGFATRFPELPRDTLNKVYPQEQRQLCAKLERLHIVLGVISVTSELIAVLWAAVEVNQLTERAFQPSYSVWDLITRDCDLAWSAVNSHFILGIIGFVGMLWLRAYVMFLSANASRKLLLAASTGTGAALFLMVSIVNRGVESGGGNSVDSYGHNILDLISHYASLLLQAATNVDSPGPLQLSAIVLELISISFMFMALVQESGAEFEDKLDEDLIKLNKCIELEDEEMLLKMSPHMTSLVDEEDDDERRRLEDSGDYSSVNVV